MTEGKLYLCSWARIPGGYRVWVKDDPTIAAEDADFEAADELLYERIMDATGDGENVHDYDPPAPTPRAGAIDRGRLWILGAQKGGTISHEPPYFEGGLCDNCLMPLGPRTEVPLLVSPITGAGGVADIRLAGAGIGAGPRLRIVSERLLALFTDAERAGFEWRRVERASRRQTYFEFIPRSSTMAWVAPKSREAPFGRCASCGFTWVLTKDGPGLPSYYVSEGDLPRPASTLVALNHRAYATPAVTDERWRTLVGRPELKGVKGTAVAIIAADAVGQPSHFSPREREKRKW